MTTQQAIELRPIGIIRTQIADADVPRRRHDMLSTIEIFDDYVAGLTGIEDYSHLFVLFALDRAVSNETMLAHPRGDRTLPEIGVFAARGRNHPNAIGLAVVELLSRHGALLKVRRLDAFDGTPVLDLKPYDDYDTIANPQVPAWWRRRAMTTRKDSG